VRDILPLGMRPSDPPMATFFIVNYTKTNFTVPYHEAAILIHVRTPLGIGVHCPWMVVDDDTALIYGRELLGYPKKMADFTFKEHDGKIQASVRRRGVEVLKMEGDRREVQNPAPPVMGRRTFNVSGMGQYFLFNPIWMLKPREVIREYHTSHVHVTLKDSEYDPVSRLVSDYTEHGRIAAIDILGSKYMLPVWFAGPLWLSHVYMMRFR
jgi:acetoacetate decarboxylase